MEGLPYELIINSNPSIAYLMRENPLYLQILIMAHCVGHSDFFKHNRMFSLTRPETVTGRFRSARNRIQKYIEDPSIGITKVEQIIDAAHTIGHQLLRYPIVSLSEKEKKKNILEKIKENPTCEYSKLDLENIPIEPEYDLLGFIIEFSSALEDWQRDILEIVKDESYYFMPQIQTKIMNEGWASYWHYRTMHELNLPQKYHLPFLKSHNQVIRPHIGGINPYHLGFKMFEKIEERYGIEECFLARQVHHDASFLRQYLTREDCEELNLFSYSEKKDGITIDDISDKEGWKIIKRDLTKQVGAGSIPVIYVESIDAGGVLVLHHDHDGRDLKLDYAGKVVDHVKSLWGNEVKLITLIDQEPFEI